MYYQNQTLEVVIREYKRICANLDLEFVLNPHSVCKAKTILRNAKEFWLEQGNACTDKEYKALENDCHICAVLQARLRNAVV